MIEQVLSQHLCSSEQLISLLATYDESIPAIFHQIAPDDSDEAWNGMQFPRIVFDIDKSGDAERKTSGTLYIVVMCTDSGENTAELIEAELRKVIDGYFFVSDEMTYAASWVGTEGFTTESNNKVFGITLTFSLLAFPLQNTAEPDTVALMNTWTLSFFPTATIINVSTTNTVFKPTDDNPAIYWSFKGISESPVIGNFFVTWFQSNLSMHVMAPSETVRNSIITQTIHELAEKTRVLFPDKKQYMIHRLVSDMTADPIRVGQLTVQGSYPVVKKMPDAAKLTKITTSY